MFLRGLGFGGERNTGHSRNLQPECVVWGAFVDPAHPLQLDIVNQYRSWLSVVHRSSTKGLKLLN